MSAPKKKSDESETEFLARLEVFRERGRKYNASPEGRAVRAKYNASPERRAASARYKKSPKGRPKERAANAKYKASPGWLAIDAEYKIDNRPLLNAYREELRHRGNGVDEGLEAGVRAFLRAEGLTQDAVAEEAMIADEALEEPDF